MKSTGRVWKRYNPPVSCDIWESASATGIVELRACILRSVFLQVVIDLFALIIWYPEGDESALGRIKADRLDIRKVVGEPATGEDNLLACAFGGINRGSGIDLRRSHRCNPWASSLIFTHQQKELSGGGKQRAGKDGVKTVPLESS